MHVCFSLLSVRLVVVRGKINVRRRESRPADNTVETMIKREANRCSAWTTDYTIRMMMAKTRIKEIAVSGFSHGMCLNLKFDSNIFYYEFVRVMGECVCN